MKYQTLSEFRAWLDGYEHSFEEGWPTAAQWLVIQDQLARVINGGYPNLNNPMPTGYGISSVTSSPRAG